MDPLLKKKQHIQELFSNCKDENAKYNRIIELGRSAPPLNPQYKVEENVVQGCQSKMYLRSYLEDGKVYFETESDALISAGLATLLTQVYSGEPPETVLKNPPDYLENLQISASLTPSRANGLYSIHLRMKQDALRMLIGY